MDTPETADPGTCCSNCGTPLAGPFCSHCGQRDRDPATMSVRAGLAHWADQALSLDGRLWRTLWVLCRSPGRLSEEYVAGRRVRWLPPLRLFLLSAVVLVLVGMLLGAAPVKVQVGGEVRALSEEERAAALEGAGEEMPELQRRLLLSDTAQLNRALLGHTSKAVVLLAPLFALCLRLFYRRRLALYVPHLIFSLHVHSFAFLLGAGGAVVIALWGGQRGGPAAVLLGLVLFAYLWQAQRRFYGAGVMKAALVTVVLGFVEVTAILVLVLGLLALLLWLPGLGSV